MCQAFENVVSSDTGKPQFYVPAFSVILHTSVMVLASCK
jgi:hypothetical protein